MKTLLLVSTLTLLAGPDTGQATYYGRGLMERVEAYRLRIGQVERCADCVDAVALLDCRHIGRKVWLKHPAGELVGPLLVVDCAARQHVESLRRRGWVVDLSWELGHERWGMRAPLHGVEVLFLRPGKPHPPIDQVRERRRHESRAAGSLQAR